MKMNVYAIYDSLVEAYGRPLFEVMDPEQFGQTYTRAIISEPDKFFQIQDSDLYLLGTFDDEIAQFALLEHPKKIASLGDAYKRGMKAAEIRRKEKQENGKPEKDGN